MNSSHLIATGIIALMLLAGCRSRSAPAPTSASSAPVHAPQLPPLPGEDSAPGASVLTQADKVFLDDLEQRSIRFFLDEADPESGLMPDRARADGGGAGVASTASVGFGLTALCVADFRGWLGHDDAYRRSLRILRFLHDHVQTHHGYFYHFLDLHTGAREWNCELSSIDTALLMAGVLTVRQHLANTEAATIAGELYEAVEWPWMLTPNGSLSMGWRPEKGFLTARWDQFNECPLIYLLALGSGTHPLPSQAWQSWRRKPVITYAGMTYIQCPPLFTHQYPQAWFDLRGLRDDYADYFQNSQLATLAQRLWCSQELSRRFPTYGPNIWGITASDGPNHYEAWGGPPGSGDIDGSAVPCAAGGSLPFAPRECLDALETMRTSYGDRIYRKYGFADAFNPATGWCARDVLGIDVGVTVAMAENCRSGFVWRTFMKNPEARSALSAARFRAATTDDALPAGTSVYPRIKAGDTVGLMLQSSIKR